MPYLGRSPTQAVRARYYYTVASGATSVTGSDDNSNTLIFSDGEFVDVSLNGVTLVAGTDYNTTTANTIAGISAMALNDVVEVVVYDVFSVFDGNVNSDFSVGGELAVTGVLTTTAATVFNGGFASNEISTISDGTSLSAGLTVENTGDTHGSVIDFFNNSESPADNDYIGGLKFKETNSAGGSHLYAKIFGMALDVTDGTEDGALTFETSAGGANTAEIMRINNTGVGIGTSSPATALDVDGGANSDQATFSGTASRGLKISTFSVGAADEGVDFDAQASGTTQALTFSTGGTERMRIDGSGLAHVGRTAAASNASGVTLQPNGQSQFVTMGNDVKSMAVGSGNDVQLTVIEFLSGGNVRGSVSVTSSATAFNTSSDVRLKENIENAKSSGSIIDQIQVREFDWKKSGEHQRHGMIAQELNEVAPEAVTTDEVHKGDMWTVDYSKLVPMMMKEIQDLRKRLTALEG